MVQLKVEYDPKIIALAAAIGFAGAFGAVSTCEQFRLATVNKRATNFTYHWVLLVGGSFGGVCVWGMHFVGMSSFRLMDGDTEIPMRYDVGNAMMLLFISLFLTFSAVMISTTDDCFNRSTKEIMEKFIARASNKYTLLELKQMGQLRIFYIVFTHSIEKPIVGGIISGGAVGLMHYVGMMGMRFQGTIDYDPGIVFASCLTSVCVIIGGFWLFFRVLSLFPSLDILRVLSACNGMFGISGLHYIGLQAATFTYDPDASPPDISTSIDRERMLVGVLLACAIYTIVIMVYVISDLRVWLLRTSSQLHFADRSLASIQKLAAGRPGTYTQIVRETTRYVRKHPQSTAVDLIENDELSAATRLQPFSVPRMLYNDAAEEDDSNSDRSPGGGLPGAGTENETRARSTGADVVAGRDAATPGSADTNVRLFSHSTSERNTYHQYKHQIHPAIEGFGHNHNNNNMNNDGSNSPGPSLDLESQLPGLCNFRIKPSKDSADPEGR